MGKLIHEGITYKIRGACFEVFNNFGYGLREKEYQRALSLALKEKQLTFKEQVYAPILFKGNKIGKQYLDFLIDGKVVLELKVGYFPKKMDFDQIKSYLKANKLELGLLVVFTPLGVKFYRSINPQYLQ